jgi:endonuclease/exonuclease/phosphatase family metal-dependent hydrolase
VLRVSERNATHTQVNRPLLREFGNVLARLDWDVALLQEAPPRWLAPLCRATGASGALALTSRNLLPGMRAALARLNPDLIASNEGGSNQLLVRMPWRIAQVRRHTMARRPERRRMLFGRLDGPHGSRLAVANVHASTGDGAATAAEVVAAAERAVEWSAGGPLVFGGDLNLRPERGPRAYAELESRLGLSAPADARAIDHLLVRGLVPVDGPRALMPAAREVSDGEGRVIRLSDHPLVAGTFEVE